MTNTWQLKRLDEVATIIGGGTPSTKDESNFGGDIPWVTPKDLSGHKDRYIAAGKRFLSEKGLSSSSAKLMPPGTVIVSSRAPIGLTAIASMELATNQGCRSLVPIESEVDSQFLYYLMSASTEFLIQHANGTTFQELPGGVMKGLHFLFPQLPEQHVIAEVLAAIDEAIDGSLKTVSLIDEALMAATAVALSESKTKVEVELNSIASFTNGYSYNSKELVEESNMALVNLKNFGRHGGFRLDGLKPLDAKVKESQHIQVGDIIVAKTDLTQGAEVIGRCLRMPSLAEYSDYVASLDVAIVRSKGDVSQNVLLGLLMQPEFREHCLGFTNGTTVLHLGSGALPSYEVLLPDDHWSSWLEQYVAALSSKQDSAIKKVAVLTKLKDFVLPRLVSGELRVNDIRQMVEATT